MSDYKRFVSYIYGYDQGEKGENTGFVKVNARGGECRIWVHVKGFYSQRQKPYRVYVFKQKRERLEGQYLGELESRNGALEWNGVTQTDSLMGGFGLDESRGIYIEGENRVFAAEWTTIRWMWTGSGPWRGLPGRKKRKMVWRNFFQRLLTVCLRKMRFLKKKKLL